MASETQTGGLPDSGPSDGGIISADLSAAERRHLIRRLFAYLPRYYFRIGAGIVLSLLVSLTNLVSLTGFVPIFNALGEPGPVTIFTIGGAERQRFDDFVAGKNQKFYQRVYARFTGWKLWANRQLAGRSSNETILLLCAALLPVYLIKIICMIGTLYLIGTAGLMAVRDIRVDLYAQLNNLGIEFFSEQRTGFIMSRIINDVELVGRSLSNEFNDALNNVFYILTHVALLAFISWKMLFITIFIVPVIMTPVSRFASRVRRAARGQQERLADLGAHVQEIISGIRVIRAFSMEAFERRRFADINNALYANTFRGHYYHQVGPALTEFVSTIVVIGFLVWGAHEIAAESLSRGLFFAFFFTLIFIMRPLKQVSIMVNLLGNAAVAAGRIFEVLDREPSIKEDPNPLPFRELRDEIRYEKVGFTYAGAARPALEKIDLIVKRGQTVSLVGSSGAGKSTFVDLLPRFYEPSEGHIYIDGVDIRRLALKDLRTSIGVVTQSIFLFNASVRENIAYGRTDVSNERLIETARTANAHDFIMELPEGYDTPLGERGVMLSGGQRQRIAIARALLRDPPILIFDEATSALDNESEKLVQEAMEKLLVNRTVFIIAHRLSTVVHSNLILVMEDGRIVERGTHQELLDNGKTYRRLYEMQFSEP